MTRKYTNYDDDFKRMLVGLVNGGKGINEVLVNMEFLLAVLEDG